MTNKISSAFSTGTGIIAAIALTGALAIAPMFAFAASISVGNAAISRANLDTYTNFTIIDTNNPVSANGTLDTFTYYADNTNPFEFVIVDAGNVVKYISPTITPAGTGLQTFSAVVPVQAGWNLGVHFDSSGTIPFDSGGAPATYTPNNSGMPTLNVALVPEGTSNRTYSWGATGDTTLIVDDNLACPGASYTTIQAAVNAASPGDTIQVCDGTYTEHVNINKSLTLEGPNVGVAGNGARVAEAIVDGSDTDAPFAVNASDVTIDGFTVRNGSNGGFQSGIWSTATNDDLLIQNNIITANSMGVLAHCGSNCVIQKNLFDGNNKPGASGGTAIYSEVSNGLTINENEFKNHTVNNPVIFAATAASVHDNLTFSNNLLLNAFGIVVIGVDVGAFTGNDVDTDDATGLTFEGADANVTVTGNLFHDGWHAVRVRDAGYGLGSNSNIVVNRNSILNHSDYGIGNEGGYTGDLNAECNWWGDATGPGPVGTGTGDGVTTLVDFTSWLTTSDLASGPCNGPLANVTVTIHKYVDGVHATTVNAASQSFPMQSSWNATNIGAGSGTFSLAPTTYDAQTSSMSSGADYATNEVTGGPVVGASCADGYPFALVGYSTGDTEALAASSTVATTSPAFTNITTDKHVIVWNKDCILGHIIIDKITIPSGDPQSFDFDAVGGSYADFAVTDAGAPNDQTLAPGVYTVTELGETGWTLTNLQCVDPTSNTTFSTASGQAQINLAAGETVTCTFTNEHDTNLTAVKTNDTSNAAVVGIPFNWIIVVEANANNSQDGASTFFNGETILHDDLPTSGATYGTVVDLNGGGTTGTVDCAIVSNTLDCVANGTVVIPDGGTITVTIPVTPTTSGSLFNPRGGGSCAVDPNGIVLETIGGDNFCADTVDVTSPPDIKVTIVKNISGVHATAANANSAAFPMASSWDAVNLGGPGSGTYTLSPVGFNTTNAYEAVTSDMTNGSDYSTNEDTSTPVVGTSCTAGKQFRLVGYSTGDSLALAQAAAVSSTSPAFTNITSDKFVIVWNELCPGTLIVKKVLIKDNGGTAATTTFAFKVNGGASIPFEADAQNDIPEPAGVYSVVENANSAYTTTYGNSANANADCNALVVPNGGTATCTITNNDKPATLIIIKNVINDNGGTALASAFTLDSGGANDTPDNFPGAGSPGTTVTLNAGSYNVTETGPSGYAQSNSSGCSGTIANGQTKTCTVTNNDILQPPPANACALGSVPGYTLVNGTPGTDVVTLAPGTMFKGNGGNDVVTSSANGNYIVCTLGGNDVIKLSGAGAATIDAGNGNNTVVTGNGNKVVTTGSGNDVISTGSGNDTINAGAGANKVLSGAGTDSLTALGGNDFFDAGAGVDTCSPGGGVNTVINCTP